MPRVVGRAPNHEIVRGVAPELAQPLQIGLETAGGHHHGAGAQRSRSRPPVRTSTDRQTAAVDAEPDDLGVVGDVDTELLRPRA